MAATAVKTDGYEPRLKRTYVDEIRPRLARDRSLNVMAVPRLVKIVVNMGVGEAVRETKTLDEELAGAVAHPAPVQFPCPLDQLVAGAGDHLGTGERSLVVTPESTVTQRASLRPERKARGGRIPGEVCNRRATQRFGDAGALERERN